jgi:alpha-tubulin suppressor-like RCC1 family protein
LCVGSLIRMAAADGTEAEVEMAASDRAITGVLTRATSLSFVLALAVGFLPVTPTGAAVSDGAVGASRIGAGGDHSCVVRPSGAVACWGIGTSGELGNGGLASSSKPVAVSGLGTAKPATAVAVGASHACALLATGAVNCWGKNGAGQLGNATTTGAPTPVAVVNLSGVTAVAAGVAHTCALLVDGTVRCWGYNASGQLGNGTTNNAASPAVVSSLNSVRAIAAGGSHTCALLAAGSVKCWGRNVEGELGQGSTSARSLTPVTVTGSLSNVSAIAAGANHTCALTLGAVRCWGSGGSGQLGNGQVVNWATPTGVSGLSRVAAITAGSAHSCALLASGTVSCWGRGGAGQLGDGTFASASLTPVAVHSLSFVTAIVAGANHVCALPAGGSPKCWGRGGSGQLGNGANTNRSTPVSVTGLSAPAGAIAVVGGQLHACALLAAGIEKCWGNNTAGAVGNGTSTTPVTTPATVVNLTNVRSISAGGNPTGTGYQHSCALVANGTARCWGNNASGELGNGTTNSGPVPSPVTVSSLTNAISISASEFHTCAVLATARVKCWGYNASGELGDGTVTQSATPVAVVGLTNAVAVVTGFHHSCALTAAGTVKCWGSNSSFMLGNSTVPGNANSPTPVAVTGLDGVVAISGGDQYTCARRANGTLKCWGSAVFGTTCGMTACVTPVLILDSQGNAFGNVSAVSAGDSHLCALMAGGTVTCWGSNNFWGQQGPQLTVGQGSATPTTVTGLSNVQGVTTSSNDSCALKATGTTWCWGDNTSGQLGTGSTTPNSSARPVQVTNL